MCFRSKAHSCSHIISTKLGKQSLSPNSNCCRNVELILNRVRPLHSTSKMFASQALQPRAMVTVLKKRMVKAVLENRGRPKPGNRRVRTLWLLIERLKTKLSHGIRCVRPCPRGTWDPRSTSKLEVDTVSGEGKQDSRAFSGSTVVQAPQGWMRWGTTGSALSRPFLDSAKMREYRPAENTRPRRQLRKITYQSPTSTFQRWSNSSSLALRPESSQEPSQNTLTTARERQWQPPGNDRIASGATERAAGNYFPEPGLVKQGVLQRQSSTLSPPPPPEGSSPDIPAGKVKGLSSEDTVYLDCGDVSSVPPKFLAAPGCEAGKGLGWAALGWAAVGCLPLTLSAAAVPSHSPDSLRSACVVGLQLQTRLRLAAGGRALSPSLQCWAEPFLCFASCLRSSIARSPARNVLGHPRLSFP